MLRFLLIGSSTDTCTFKYYMKIFILSATLSVIKQYRSYFPARCGTSTLYLPVREYLNAFLGRWVERRGHHGSPDLTSFGLFSLEVHKRSGIFDKIWRFLNSATTNYLCVCAGVMPEILTNVRNQVENGLYYCQHVFRAHFEHL